MVKLTGPKSSLPTRYTVVHSAVFGTPKWIVLLVGQSRNIAYNICSMLIFKDVYLFKKNFASLCGGEQKFEDFKNRCVKLQVAGHDQRKFQRILTQFSCCYQLSHSCTVHTQYKNNKHLSHEYKLFHLIKVSNYTCTYCNCI